MTIFRFIRIKKGYTYENPDGYSSTDDHNPMDFCEDCLNIWVDENTQVGDIISSARREFRDNNNNEASLRLTQQALEKLEAHGGCDNCKFVLNALIRNMSVKAS